MGVLVSGTRLYVRRAVSVLFVQDFSSPQLDDKYQGYTDLLHPMCGSAVRARVRNGDATTGRRGTFQYGTRHAVHGTDGSHSRV